MIFKIIKKMFIELLTGLVNELLTDLVNGCDHKKCVSLGIQRCETQPTLIDLHPNKYSQEFHYYLFSVKLDRCVGGCNTLNDLPNKVCVPNKTEDLNLSVFNIITGINESKSLPKDISCKCKGRFDGKSVIQINGGIKINVDVNVKNVIYVKKIIFGILLHVVAEMENI